MTGKVTIGEKDAPQRVNVTGDVSLIVADGCTLTVNGGINVGEEQRLTIYVQSTGDGMGKLISIGTDFAPTSAVTKAATAAQLPYTATQ